VLKKKITLSAVIIVSAFPLLYISAELLGGLSHSVQGELGFLFTKLHRQAGEYAIFMITAALSCTPLRILTGNNKILRYKKVFGIYTFIYTLLHFVFYLTIYNFMDIFREMALIVALIAALIITLLGLTSNAFSRRLLKQNWKKLHEFAYAAAIAAVLHIALSGKGLWPVYGVILTTGFILRIPSVEYYFRKRRTNYSIGSAL
jgi:sulfoxide reductase heme-binding subunit YedZ